MNYKKIDYTNLVSPIALERVLGGFTAEEDNFLEEYPNFDVNNEEDVRTLVRNKRPASDYKEINNCNRLYFNSFCYFLTTNDIDFAEFFDTQSYLPFEKPKNPKQFFVWMFEEIFPGASWQIDNVEKYTITTNHLLFWIACSDDPIAYIDDPDFQDQVRSFNFESKYKFKE